MLKRTERISFRISSVLSKVEPDLHTGSGQKVPAPTGSTTLLQCLDLIRKHCSELKIKKETAQDGAEWPA